MREFVLALLIRYLVETTEGTISRDKRFRVDPVLADLMRYDRRIPTNAQMTLLWKHVSARELL